MAGDDNSKEMFFRHRAERDKYAYFLLAAAGSALAFAVQKTDGLMLRWNMIALAGAAISWIASFYFGCQRLSASHESLGANYRYLRMAEEVASEHKFIPAYDEVQAEIMKELMGHANRSATYSRRQFQLLVTGVVFFLIWHVWTLYAHTFGASRWAQ